MRKYFFDTETCGFNGVMVLLQYAIDDGPINLVDVWKEPVGKVKEIFSEMSENIVIGFNLAFDWFHMTKFANLMYHLPDDYIMADHIEEVYQNETNCKLNCYMRPASALDLMLYARKGPYQTLMRRKPIKIRRVHRTVAHLVAQELEQRVYFDNIYFSQRANKFLPQWSIRDNKNSPDFKDIVLEFKPSASLKALARHALGVNATEFKEVAPSTSPKIPGWRPFGGWRHYIKNHIDHWAFNKYAREYGTDDVDNTRKLYYSMGEPEHGDDDSILACAVGACRWRGWDIDFDRLKAFNAELEKKIRDTPTAANQARYYIQEHMDETEKSIMGTSTAKIVLESIAKESKCDCFFDGIENGCEVCEYTGLTIAARRAQEVLAARKAKKLKENIDKLLIAKRLHADFKVIGTLSSRMSGNSDFNAQGMQNSKEFRECFLLGDDVLKLCGGDFDSFEVCIYEAWCGDPQLREDLQRIVTCHKCDGVRPKQDTCAECKGLGEIPQKIHALFAMQMFPGLTYDEVIRDKGKYTKGKNGVFSMLYGGNWETLVRKYGVEEKAAQQAETRWFATYPGTKKIRETIIKMFCSMTQPGGNGTKVYWAEPAEYIESLMGFRRYFTLENKICKALFDLGETPPPEWKEVRAKIIRKLEKGLQTPAGAAQSALFGAAFGIQSSSMRAAANHVIQSTGATITKRVQRNIWELQPVGIHEWKVQPLNIHDEVMCATADEYKEKVKQTVNETVESFRELIPLIKMEWTTDMNTWADK